MKQPIWDYDFNAVNPVDFKLEAQTVVDNETFMTIIKTSARAHARLKELNTENTDEVFEKFRIVPLHDKYLNLLKTRFVPAMRQVEATIWLDRIKIVRWEVTDAYATRENKKYVVHLEVEGQYQRITKELRLKH